MNPSRVVAVLGPTNTGKTHLAIERMLGHESGMIGFPLRLLARENFDRIVRLKGRQYVALITGEEKIIPAHPRWFVCTVESMPLDRPVAFLAVDEVQLAADPDRGHVFTDRILHARGSSETMFMGSDSIRPLLRKLVPEAEQIVRPRFSTLTYTGPRKITRLPPRSAMVAFSVADVFNIAELVRRQRGGTAVVMGALSPRARNAQVAMYQAGEVDFMVATDAIGMGLNMDLDHVAFARLSKFDGRHPRALSAAEIGQIAGRAGRHMNDGTFGTTDDCGPLDEELVEAVENHRYDPLTSLWWRNDKLDFRSAQALLRSLERPAPSPILLRASEADDHQALIALCRQSDIAKRANTPAMVRLLWDVCQIPDFRKVMSDHHAKLLMEIFRSLAGPTGKLQADWIARQLARLDRVDGEIDTLVQRIAHIRTWTYITHRPGWMAEAAHWQARALAIEDRLSDALHDRITQRFVDRRSAILVRQMKERRDLEAVVTAEGDVIVEGQFVGTMQGLQFTADPAAIGEELKILLAAANRVLREEVLARAGRLASTADGELSLQADAVIRWQGSAIARLTSGDTALTPRIELEAALFLDGEIRERVRRRLATFIRDHIEHLLHPLMAEPIGLDAAGRGLLFQLAERLGIMNAPDRAIAASLTGPDRRTLMRLGIQFGQQAIFIRRFLKPEPLALRALLWSVWRGLSLPPVLPLPGRLSVSAIAPAIYAEMLGYPVRGTRSIRLDRLESFTAHLRELSKAGGFTADGSLAAMIGAPRAELDAIIEACGYRRREEDGKILFYAAKRLRPGGARKSAAKTMLNEHHPFAPLRKLATA